MSKTPITRNMLRHLVNVSEDSSTEDWQLINEGVTELTEEFNPDTESIQYIADEDKTTFTKSYAPSLSITFSIVSGDKVNTYFRKKIDKLPKGSKADTAYIRFNLLDEVSGSTGTYTAYKREANISVDSIGGSAEDYLGATISLNSKGDATEGTVTYDKTTSKWTFTAKTSTS